MSRLVGDVDLPHRTRRDRTAGPAGSGPDRHAPTLAEMIWLLVCGERPSPEQARLLEAALVAGVDHGPQAPSIAIARMAATCGIGLNGAIATGVNVLGDVHGGAGQQCVELLNEICDRSERGTTCRRDGPRGARRVARAVAVHPGLRAPVPPRRPAARPAAVHGGARRRRRHRRRAAPGRGRAIERNAAHAPGRARCR